MPIVMDSALPGGRLRCSYRDSFGLDIPFLSAGRSNLVSGVKRIGAVFLPPILLTLWQIVPLLLQALALEHYTNHNTVPNDETLLFIPGSIWVPTLNLVYIPLILSLALACLLV